LFIFERAVRVLRKEEESQLGVVENGDVCGVTFEYVSIVLDEPDEVGLG
jgi:hypothetical protein